MDNPGFLSSRVISAHSQERFAAFCGDRNPMHMDPVAARRTQAGQPVVHGIHTLLWALETLAAAGAFAAPLTHIKAKFLKWVYLGDEAALSQPAQGKNPPRLQIEVLGLPVLTADLLYKDPPATPHPPHLVPSPAAPRASALDLTFAELGHRQGDAYTAPPAEAVRLFPQLAAVIRPEAVAEIAACSYLVGMEAPGLHSMFSKLDLTLRKVPAPVSTALHYAITSHDERFRKAQLTVTGSSIAGTLDVFVRIPPVRQASMELAASHVEASEFAGMQALVLGGSRGLGEITAKLIAAGGGSPILTYTLGRTEAEAIADEIRHWGGHAATLAYDVRQPAATQLHSLVSEPTHVFYCATSNIYRPKKGVLSASLLAEFTQFYLRGFYDLCTALLESRTSTGAKLIVFYPSTAFIDDRPIGMTEYAMIKAAGEQLCADMNLGLPALEILAPRLPRLPTDQTAGVLPEHHAVAIDALLPILRQMRDRSRTLG